MAEYKGKHKCEVCERDFNYSFATANAWGSNLDVLILDIKNWATVIPPSKEGLPEYELKMHCPRGACDHLNFWRHKVE